MVPNEFWKVLPDLKGWSLVVGGSIVLAVLGYFYVRFLLASGTERLNAQVSGTTAQLGAQQAERRDTISILQAQLAVERAEKLAAEAENRLTHSALRECEQDKARLEVVTSSAASLRAMAERLDNEMLGEAPALSGMPRLLLVDDNADTRRALQLHLSHLAYNVTVAPSAGRALKVCEAAQMHGPVFDLLILDEAMPQLSGTQLLKKLREQGDLTPVAFFSGHLETLKAQDEDWQALGVRAFWKKPVDFAQLHALVEEALR